MTATTLLPHLTMTDRSYQPAPSLLPSKHSRTTPSAYPGRSESVRRHEDDEADLDDLAWAARVLEGDEDAAKVLFERLYPTVIKCVRYRLPRRTSEEDLVQAIYARIFTHLDQFSGTVPLEHWVSRIAVNTCLNQLKHERVRPELRMADLREEEEAVVRHLWHTTDEAPVNQSGGSRELLDQLLARLRPDERLVITLLHLEEKTTKEISDLTGWSITLVKVKAFRSRQKLRKLWRALAANN